MDRAQMEQLYAYPATDGPWVRGAMISTIDGAATTAEGKTNDLGGEADKQVFALLRSLADVILVGANTTRVEGYRPVHPDEVDQDLRQRLGLAPVPRIAVVSHSGNVPAELRDSEIVFEGDVDLRAVIDELSRLGLNRINAEGGPHLLGQLVEHDLLDEICLTIAPVMAAGDAPRIAPGATAVDRPFTLAHIEPVGDVLLGRWIRA